MTNTDLLINYGISYAVQHGMAHTGDYVITTSGRLEGVSGGTNIMRVNVVDSSDILGPGTSSESVKRKHGL